MKKVICLSIIVLLIIGIAVYRYVDKSYHAQVYSSRGSCLYKISINKNGKKTDIKNISTDIYSDFADNTILQIIVSSYFKKAYSQKILVVII